MTLVNPTAVTGMFLNSGLEKLSRSHPENIEQEKARLKQASKEFESLFMYQMLKEMRKTVGDNPLTKDMPFSNDISKDTFMDMFDMQLSREMADGSRGSIADMLYKSLVKSLELKKEVKTSEAELKPLHPPEKKPIELDRNPVELVPSRKPFPLHNIKEKPIPIDTRQEQVPTTAKDSIIEQYGALIEKAARETGLDSALIYGVIKAESGGDPHAVSPAGAKGLMQLMDSTAAELGTTNVYDPQENISSGSRYLKQQLNRFGEVHLALAAYNAGPETVNQYRGVPPYRETKDYIARVLDAVQRYKQIIAETTPKAP